MAKRKKPVEIIGDVTFAKGHSFSMSWSMPEVADDESRLFWMSFCDPDKPTGQQFLGVSIVRVYGSDVNAMAMELFLRGPMPDPENGPWVAAACRKAHDLGINPGGEVALHQIPDEGAGRPNYPENVALTPEQLKDLGAKPQTASGQ